MGSNKWQLVKHIVVVAVAAAAAARARSNFEASLHLRAFVLIVMIGIFELGSRTTFGVNL